MDQSPSRLKQRYWELAQQGRRARRLLRPENHGFGREVARTQWAALTGGVRPLVDQNVRAIRAAVDWVLRAQAATPDDGVSLGYFPADVGGGWMPSYPETTGYIIPTLLDFAALAGDTAVRDRALAAARWECQVQMRSGAVQGGPVCEPERQHAAVFNTGMVLQGWSAAWRTSNEATFLESATRAGRFLVNDLDDEGHLRTHGPFVTPARIKTYNVLCAWGLLQAGRAAGETSLEKAAVKMGEAALSQQLPNGWFENNDLVDPTRALTHTIGYTLQGLLEVGILTARADFIEAARKGIEAVAARVAPSGFLAGRFDRNWAPVVNSVCLTGSAQLAVVMYRLDEITQSATWWPVADRLVNFLKALQRHDCADPNVNGATAGSFPLLGEYMTAGYPNWATKYFLDAVLLQDRARQGAAAGTRAG